MTKIEKAIEALIKYKGQQRISEFKKLLEFIEEKQIKYVLEIGAYDGGTTAAFLEMGCKVISIDLKHRANFKHENLNRIEGNSQSNEVMENVTFLYTNLDFNVEETLLFIDGDHTEQGMLNDYFEYFSTAKHFAFHDIKDSEFHAKHNCFVSKAWNKIKLQYKPEDVLEFCETSNDWTNEAFKDMQGVEGAGGIGVLTLNL